MKVLFGHDALVGEYLKQRVQDAALVPGQFTSMGFTNDAETQLICGVVFFNFRPWDVEIGIAADSPRWCQRWALKVIFGYCFDQLGVQRVSGMQAASNERAHKLVEGLGFRKEGVIRNGWFGREDAWIYGMMRHECRWLEEHNHEHRRRKGRGRRSAETAGPGKIDRATKAGESRRSPPACGTQSRESGHSLR